MKDINYDFLYSSTLLKGINSLDDFHSWFAARVKAGEFKVNLKPLNNLKGWKMDEDSGTYGHQSGKFFGIKGLHVEREVNENYQTWTQLIVNQAEQGVLGLLAKKIDGIIHVLVQAKMEPGNIGFLQISPTVQSTRSNYTRVHGGKSTKYIEYFLGKTSGTTIFNQLRSEQGSRYYRKRNQNIVILLEENHDVIEDQNFFWLTLGQLRELHKIPNLVHLDCRSIIGGMPLSIPYDFNAYHLMLSGNKENLDSLFCYDSNALCSMRDLLSWFTQEKVKNIKHTKLIPISDVEAWAYDGISIKHDQGRFFDIIGVEVYSPDREVSSWSQPLIKCANGGIIGLIAQVHNGILHFLIQARFEAGFIDTVELAPTVQYSPKNYEIDTNIHFPFFNEYFKKNSKYELLVNTFLSNEGGRFFKSENKHIVIKVPDTEVIEVKTGYEWMTLSQLHYFGSMELTLNVELRSLIFCLTLA